MTLAQLQGLFQAVVAMINVNFIKKKTLLAQITAGDYDRGGSSNQLVVVRNCSSLDLTQHNQDSQ